MKCILQFFMLFKCHYLSIIILFIFVFVAVFITTRVELAKLIELRLTIKYDIKYFQVFKRRCLDDHFNK
jgi:hypothetical protein